MSDRLTSDEVWARYPDEWVALQDPDVGPKDEILGGRVVCHSKDRVEVHCEVRRRQPGDFAIFFTGEPWPYPVDTTAVVLNWPNESQPRPLLVLNEEGLR